MDQKKQILEKLLGELKLIDPENFAYACVEKLCWSEIYELYCDYRIDQDELIFTIDENFDLKLYEEVWANGQKSSTCNYVLGEPNVKTIIIACYIFHNEGRGKYWGCGKSIIKLLDEYKKFNHTKSAKSIL